MERLRPASPWELARMLDTLAEAVTVTEADGQLVFANAAALQRMGTRTLEDARALGPSALLARFEITDERGQPIDAEDLPGRRLLLGKSAEPVLLRMVSKSTGHVSWTLVKANSFENDQGRRLAVNVLEDVTEAKEQALRERFLSYSSAMLAESLDYEQTLRRVAELVVPDLADWCSVDMLDSGVIRQLAVAHVDPAKVAHARELRDRYPPSLGDPTGVGAVLRTGSHEFYPTISEELLATAARDEEQLQVARELQMRSAMIVPMCTRDHRVLGAITLVAADTAGAFDEAALAFAQEFAGRAATAVENARLYRERHETAETLQRSLLPTILPAVAGWRIASLYRPAAPAGVIGGDFYDMFLTEGGFTAVIGDVTGKGIEAAALTALARNSLRASALLGLSPAGSLGLLNRLLLDRSELSLATAAVARVMTSGDTTTLTLACAGHPLPLLQRSGGAPTELGEVGILLGFEAASSWREQTVAIAPGDTVLFYTDGVTDAPGRRERLGESGLLSLISGASADPDELLAALARGLDEFCAGGALDDIAALAVRLLPTVAEAEPAVVQASGPSVAVE